MFLEDFWFCIFMRYIDEDDKLIRYSYLLDDDDESLAGEIEFQKNLFDDELSDPELLDAFMNGKARIVKTGENTKFLSEDGFDMFGWMALALLRDEYKRLGGYPENTGFINMKHEEIVMRNADKVNRVLAKKTDTVKPC